MSNSEVEEDFSTDIVAAGRSRTGGAIRKSVVAFGIALSLVQFVIVVQMEQVRLSGNPSGLALYYNVVAALLILVAANKLLRRFMPGIALSQTELLCLFSMMSVGTALAGGEMLGTIVPSLAFPAYWTSGNHPEYAGIGRKILATLPSWSLLRSTAAAVDLFDRHKPGTPLNLFSWIAPLTLWGVLLALTTVMAGAAARLITPRWEHEERLSFPLVALPLAITSENSDLFTNRLFWTGFAAAAGLDLINGLAVLIPNVPSVNVKVHMIAPGAGPALQALGWTPLTFHPLMIALAYFVPNDVLFSSWFFYVLTRMELYVTGAMGRFEGSQWQYGASFPGLNEQNAGALFVLGGAMLWALKPTLVAAFSNRQADHSALDPSAGKRRRIDVLTIFAGTIVWSALLVVLGVPPLLLPLFLIIAGLLALLAARLRAEMGMPMHNLHFITPDVVLGSVFGSSSLSFREMAGLVSIHGILRSRQCDIFPHLVEGHYLASVSSAGTDKTIRQYLWATSMAAIICGIIGPWIMAYLMGSVGLENNPTGFNPISSEGWTQLSKWVSHPIGHDYRALGLTVFGGIVTLALLKLRLFWPESPFHPVGFAISGTFALSMMVVPMFIAWVIKSLILRFGGLRTYRSFVPLMFGVMTGEFVMGTGWAMIGMVFHVQTYQVWLF